MPRGGFETTIPVSVGAKTFSALDRAATAIGHVGLLIIPKKTRPSQEVSRQKQKHLEDSDRR
jgi:hypothetical protein